MQPGSIYYLVLYCLIIILRFFKTYPLVKDKPNEYNWKHYFFVSLDIVYTSAGVVILLIAQQTVWVAVIMILYVTLVVVSSFLDTVGARFKDNSRLFIHLIIVILIVSATMFSYARLLPKSYCEGATSASNKQYKVIIPYHDIGLEKYVGSSKLNGKSLTYFTDVSASTREEALKLAKEKSMKGDAASIVPFNQKANLSTEIILMPDEAVVEETTKT